MISKDIMAILSDRVRKEATDLKEFQSGEQIQEIRIKANKPLMFISNNKEIRTSYISSKEDIRQIVQRISSYSIYAFEDEIRQGFITIQGGHRIGLCGTCVTDKSSVKTIKYISSVNIRIARDVKGCGSKVIPYIVNRERVMNTIIISPPKCGKTTMLRDITRQLSEGIPSLRVAGKNVTVVDERSEIAACYRGIPQMDIGIRTDVLDNCPKSEGIIMAIRSMAPAVVICDEIGTPKDMESIVAALNSGVSVITTIHGFNEKDLSERPVFIPILENKVFDRAVILSAKRGVGTIEYVYDFKKSQKLWG